MKKLLQKIVFVLGLLVVASTSTYAVNGIGLSLISYTFDSSDCSRDDHGVKIIVNALLVNYDATAYTGPLSFGLRNNYGDLTHAPGGIFEPPQGFGGGNTTLVGNAQLPVTFTVRMDAPAFRPGPDLVVVWPISAVPVADSVTIQVMVPKPDFLLSQQATGITDVSKESFSYIIQPQVIRLVNLSAALNFKQVRITDAKGQQVVTLQADQITEISLPDMAAGVYICQLITSTGDRKQFKFVH